MAAVTSVVILEPKKIKSVAFPTFSLSVYNEVMRPDAMILVFWMLSFKTAFSFSSFTIKKLFSSSSLFAIRMVSSACLRMLIFLLAVLIPACDSSSFRLQFTSVQFSRSVVSDSLQPHEPQPTRPPCPSPTPSLLKLMSIESVMPSNHLILCHLLLPLPLIFPIIRIFSNESALHITRPKYLQHQSFQWIVRVDFL